MNRLLAVMLVVAVPALAQQQVSLVPQTEEPQPAADAVKTDCEAFPWKPVVITGAALTVVAVIAIVAMVASSSASRPIMKSDFNCGRGGCDSYINEPQQ